MGKQPRCCQSCGIPLNAEHKAKGLVSEATSGPEAIYCKLCFQDGHFTSPEMTMQQMIEIATQATTPTFGAAKARREMTKLIPTLARWQTGATTSD